MKKSTLIIAKNSSAVPAVPECSQKCSFKIGHGRTVLLPPSLRGGNTDLTPVLLFPILFTRGWEQGTAVSTLEMRFLGGHCSRIFGAYPSFKRLKCGFSFLGTVFGNSGNSVFRPLWRLFPTSKTLKNSSAVPAVPECSQNAMFRGNTNSFISMESK